MKVLYISLALLAVLFDSTMLAAFLDTDKKRPLTVCPQAYVKVGIGSNGNAICDKVNAGKVEIVNVEAYVLKEHVRVDYVKPLKI